MARALITGITGQDGGFLAELLLERGDTVIGTTRGDPAHARRRMPAGAAAATLQSLDLGDAAAIQACLRETEPDHVYHLAAPAAPNEAWTAPAVATDALCTVPARLLEAALAVAPHAHLVFAGSCQAFGPDSRAPQDERTAYTTRTPYGAGKAFSTLLVSAFREGRGLHAGTAILFNHESGRRSSTYVTAKICQAAVRIAAGASDASPLRLGALDVVRDWGHARDHMRALIAMADAPDADDYVVGTGHGRTVAEFCEVAFGKVGLDWKEHVVSDTAFARAGDVPALVANPAKIRQALGWAPTVTFDALVDEMLDAARDGATNRSA